MNNKKKTKDNIIYYVNEPVIEKESILADYTEKIANKTAQYNDLKVAYLITKHAKIKKIFGRWLFILCDTKSFTNNVYQENQLETYLSQTKGDTK